MTILRRIPLTPKIILLTVSAALLSWGLLEYTQNKRLQSIFEAQLNRQLAVQAQEARVRFDNYVNAYNAAVEVTISQRRFTDYLSGRDLKAAKRMKYYNNELPPWMPAPSVLRRLVRVSYAILMDEDGNVREVYQGIAKPLPQPLLKPGSLLRALSSNQSLMTSIDGTPFVITAGPILEQGGGEGRRIKAILMFASPLDDDFLADSQGFAGAKGIVVLMSEAKVIASNRPDVLPGGTIFSEAERNYLVMGKSFFDIGSSDLLVEFASLISKKEYEALGTEVLAAGRRNRIGLTLLFIVIFSAVMSGITRRVQRLTRRIADFSEKKLGGLSAAFSKGDQLEILDKSFQRLTEEVEYATGKLERARDELELRVDERTAELRESVGSYRTLAENLPGIVYRLYLREQNRMQFFNKMVEQMTGYSIGELEKGEVCSIDPFILRDDKERVTGEVTRAIDSDRPFEVEYRLQHKQGGIKYFVERGRPVRDADGAPLYIDGVILDISERKQAEETIKYQAYHDLLTGLSNKARFLDILNHEILQTQRVRKKLAVLSLDIDQFKNVNDSLGHAAGDKLIQDVAVRLKSCVREFDTIARIGGDEFLILLPLLVNPQDASRISEKLMEAVKKPFRINHHELRLTASVGISLYPDDGESAEALIKNADIALHYAKDQGRDNHQFFNVALNIRTLDRIRFENRLRQAVERGELVVYYQPQQNIKTRKLTGVEALVRWNHPEMGLLSPMQFVPLAEEIGLIIQIDQWVLRTACEQLKAWEAAGHAPQYITTNLSARQFQQPRLAEMISDILKETNLRPECLGIEITETIAMQDTELTAGNVNRLNALGVHFFIDDFGTGYSSLSYLKKLPIHKLKIDQSFIAYSTKDRDYQAIINAIIAMAHILKLKVVAEGVETEDQMSFLDSRDCDEMQGYLFSEPLPAGEFEKLLV